MSMVINTNLEATRTGNIYNRNNAYMNQALSRVATGQKINSAKDNASLYAISEKMRERMRANDQANQNIQNDTALLKTAQGGIGNTIDILKTLKERALNAANDSNQNSDRGIIAAEVKELVKQINDNAAKVKFNGKSLINGDADTTVAATVASISTANSSSSASTTDPSAYAALETAGTVANVDATAAADKSTAYTHDVFRLGDTNILDNFKKINGANTATVPSNTKLVELLKSDATDVYGERVFEVGDKLTLNFKVDGVETSNTYTVASADVFTTAGIATALSGNGVKLQIVSAANQDLKDSSNNAVKKYGTDGTDGAAADKVGTANQVAWYVIGDNGKKISDLSLTVTSSVEGVDYNKTYAQTQLAATAVYGAYRDPEDTTTTTPTTTSNNAYTFYIGGEQGFNLDVTIGGINMSTLFPSYTEDSFAKLFEDKTTAITAVDAIDKALNTALVEQAQLGAIESRLGYTSDNLITMNENLEAADSAFRDADIAKEMTNYMKYAVLSQASQYMLAQAGQNAYQVLNLLQP